MTDFTLISHTLCPYVQRALIACAEKNIDYERINIDLENKPDWFLAVSPTGKVPMLQTAQGSIFESAVILEYIEDTTQNPMHPADPFIRAQHRSWMDFGSSILSNISGVYRSKDAAVMNGKVSALRQQFEQLETILSSTNGPFFNGEQFMLVDAVYGPIYRYFDVLETIADFDILENLPNNARWRSALKTRKSVIDAVAPDYHQELCTFIIECDGHLGTLISAN